MTRQPLPAMARVSLPGLPGGVLALCSVALLASGCAASGVSEAASELDGRSFVSESVTNGDGSVKGLVVGTEIQMSFTTGRIGDTGEEETIRVVAANGGCVGAVWNGGYNVDGGRLVVTGPRGSALVGCDPVVQEQDAWIVDLVESSPKLEIDGGRIVLTSDEGSRVVLVEEP